MPQTPYSLPSGGTKNSLNITAATVVKATPGQIVTISVLTAGSTAGSVNDVATIGAVAAANKTLTIPNTVGVIYAPFRHSAGIVVTPGTGQVLSVAFE